MRYCQNMDPENFWGDKMSKIGFILYHSVQCLNVFWSPIGICLMKNIARCLNETFKYWNFVSCSTRDVLECETVYRRIRRTTKTSSSNIHMIKQGIKCVSFIMI